MFVCVGVGVGGSVVGGSQRWGRGGLGERNRQGEGEDAGKVGAGEKGTVIHLLVPMGGGGARASFLLGNHGVAMCRGMHASSSSFLLGNHGAAFLATMLLPGIKRGDAEVGGGTVIRLPMVAKTGVPHAVHLCVCVRARARERERERDCARGQRQGFDFVQRKGSTLYKKTIICQFFFVQTSLQVSRHRPIILDFLFHILFFNGSSFSLDTAGFPTSILLVISYIYFTALF